MSVSRRLREQGDALYFTDREASYRLWALADEQRRIEEARS
jgi:hypothetical protein